MENLTIEKVANLIGQLQLNVLDLQGYVEKLEAKIAELEKVRQEN
jgi:hypothetical protein